MSWKTFILQSMILAGFSYLIVQYISQNNLSEFQFQQEDLSAEIQILTERLNSLDQQIININHSRQAGITVQQTIDHNSQKTTGTTGEKEKETKLHLRIQTLEEKEKAMQETIDTLAGQQEKLRQFQKQSVPEHVKVKSWLSGLPTEKKTLAQDIYREQQELMMNAVPVGPESLPPSPEEMLSILQKNREGLKVKLKQILNREEYQAFLESLDESDLPPGLPLIVQ